jgi:hypothetical protein
VLGEVGKHAREPDPLRVGQVVENNEENVGARRVVWARGGTLGTTVAVPAADAEAVPAPTALVASPGALVGGRVIGRAS